MFKSIWISTTERNRLTIQRKENEQYTLLEPEMMKEYDIQSAGGGGIGVEGGLPTPILQSKGKKKSKGSVAVMYAGLQ